VTSAIRTPEISRGASVVSARPVVREKLLGLQRELGLSAHKGAVSRAATSARSSSDARVKFFLTASDEARAQRRHTELAEKGLVLNLSDVLADQRRRDKDDTERAISPCGPRRTPSRSTPRASTWPKWSTGAMLFHWRDWPKTPDLSPP